MILLVLFSCRHKEPVYSHLKFTVTPGAYLKINNTRKEDLHFKLKWNGMFSNMDTILWQIRSMRPEFEGEPLERKAWRFVISHMDFSRNVFDDPRLHDPLLQFNSLGYGQCDDMATALYFIWKALGFEARIWGLGKHVVPEVYSNGTWQMYDASFQVYYNNAKGSPAGVEELTRNNRLIYHPFNRIKNTSVNNIDTNIIDKLRYSNSVGKHYLSDTGHFITASYYQTFRIRNMDMSIPPRSTVLFPYYDTRVFTELDWNKEPTGNNYYLKLIIEPGVTGTIKMPLMMIGISGNAEFCSEGNNNKIYTVNRNGITHLQAIDTAFRINRINEQTIIYYKVPKLFKKTQEVSLEGLGLNEAEVSLQRK